MFDTGLMSLVVFDFFFLLTPQNSVCLFSESQVKMKYSVKKEKRQWLKELEKERKWKIFVGCGGAHRFWLIRVAVVFSCVSTL